MAKISKYRVSPTRSNDMVCRMMGDAEVKSTMMLTAGRYEGRRVELDDRMLYNFGTCSYMGLDMNRDLQEAAAAAVFSYGTQFSISRAYLQCPMYTELETTLKAITGRPVLVAPSTTLAHMAALPALVHDRDAVLIDQFAHASLQLSTQLLHDVPVRLVRHNRIDQVEALLKELSTSFERIWYVIDGLYSMCGDFAPFDDIARLLERWPQLHIYIDDAHATSWLGLHGRGGALMRLGFHHRVVVALSLNKGFAAAGAALVLPDEELKARIRRCGGPMLFSGPIQPPMLGVALASAKRHLTSEHALAQAELMKRIDHTLAAARASGLELATQHRTPIFFIPHDSVTQATDHVQALIKRDFYVCPSAFPAVPMNRPGVRFTISLHNELEDIDELIAVALETSPYLTPPQSSVRAKRMPRRMIRVMPA
jgi:7-keto-8-aminopelargonate synthetase-like enzyme